MINKFDEIVNSVELTANIGITGARTYFQGIKRMPDREAFNKLWKVMTEQQYDLQFKNNLHNSQMEKGKYDWWKDEERYLDIDQ
jgi:hypothetical protein